MLYVGLDMHREPPAPEGSPPDPEEVVCEERLGGLPKSYRRRAA